MNREAFFESLLDLIIEDYSEYLYTQSKYLCHYTNLQGAYGIIKSRCLWATNIYYLNDTSEYRYSLDALNMAIISIEKRYSTKRFKIFKETLLNHFTYKNSIPPIHIISFSEKLDSLSQWRGYGELNNSYNLVFSANKLWPITKAECLILKVIYDKEIQQYLLSNIISNAYEFFIKSQKRSQKNVAKFIEHLKFFLHLFLPIIKDPSFEEELEVRVIINKEHFENDDYFKMEHRLGKQYLIPYVLFPLSPSGGKTLDSLDKIVVGPNAYPELAVASMKTLLQTSFDWASWIKVEQSTVPFRV
ncbi:DUF2971 domain-containing protein [Leptospira alstonii]|uniref:PF11185 family protein n=2 Tax=Leptospira alstonii TaxID=28452 RepID=M6D318_9LEPT|nr:DUF2971 domain-containing protein [Leptospira alstonii]EMJ97086.1 PF11185 family protein [Leptospira alstonii serovar Sichuan str. 79601]EQA81694.1 PF11185 family protein [Leptospira alstonii serovar Pingchang str. 80-412]